TAVHAVAADAVTVVEAGDDPLLLLRAAHPVPGPFPLATLMHPVADRCMLAQAKRPGRLSMVCEGVHGDETEKQQATTAAHKQFAVFFVAHSFFPALPAEKNEAAQWAVPRPRAFPVSEKRVGHDQHIRSFLTSGFEEIHPARGLFAEICRKF